MSEPTRLLLITLSNIGDAIMTTPVLQAMHELHPQARIDIVADRRSAALFEPCPFRGEIIIKDKKAGWPGLLSLIGRLRRQRYRLIVDLRTDGLSWLLRGEQRRTKRDAISPGVHAVERAYAVIAPLLPPTTPRTRLWLADEHLRFADEQLRALPGDRLLAIAPGANWSGKIWPEANFRELIDALAAKVDALLLLGGQGDATVCASLAQTGRLPVLNLAGSTTLLQAASLLSRATLFIGNDSGLGHLCAAVGRPTLTLFGPGDPDRYHPWGPQAHWLVAADGDIASLSPSAVAARAIELLRPQESIDQ